MSILQKIKNGWKENNKKADILYYTRTSRGYHGENTTLNLVFIFIAFILIVYISHIVIPAIASFMKWSFEKLF